MTAARPRFTQDPTQPDGFESAYLCGWAIHWRDGWGAHARTASPASPTIDAIRRIRMNVQASHSAC